MLATVVFLKLYNLLANYSKKIDKFCMFIRLNFYDCMTQARNMLRQYEMHWKAGDIAILMVLWITCTCRCDIKELDKRESKRIVRGQMTSMSNFGS